MLKIARDAITCVGMLGVISGCGSGGGTSVRQSSGSLSVDGVEKPSTSQSSGVDGAGKSNITMGGTDWSVTVRIPATATGSILSGAEVTYTDINNNAFLASDTQAGSSLTIMITANTSTAIEGSFTSTVVGPSGATHALMGRFKLVLEAMPPANHYQGTYFGIFRMQGQKDTGRVDPDTRATIWGPLLTFSFRATFKLDCEDAFMGTTRCQVTHADVSDSFFNCVGGCTPVGGYFDLPEEPGMALRSHGFIVQFNDGAGTRDLFGGRLGLYTSTDGRILSNALGDQQGWQTLDERGAREFEEVKFGVNEVYLNQATFSTTWSLTRSAL